MENTWLWALAHKYGAARAWWKAINSVWSYMKALFRLPILLDKLARGEITIKTAAGPRWACDSCGKHMIIVKTEPYIWDTFEEVDLGREWIFLKCEDAKCFRHTNFWRLQVVGSTAH